ncbi:MAG: nucleoside triphosphate pyrophosphohydrolase [Candidatus Phaeomarinobacter sp.]
MAALLPSDKRRIETLLAIMARLRDPDGGCPWDLEQSFETIARYTIEEAYEVADAIQRGDRDDLKDELGDLLLQVVFHSRIAEDEGSFVFDDVVEAISSKMIRRHPHVFGEGDADTPTAVKGSWEKIKAEERAAKSDDARPGTLDGIPKALPALVRAVKLQKRAARVGFDWPQTSHVLDKLAEETAELKAEVDKGAPADRVMDELGDILFVYANLARHLDVDPEQALSGTNAKFERRFRQIENWLAEDGRTPDQSTLEEMDALWTRAKNEERSLTATK